MFPKTFQKLIEDFSRLPSIGPKMAERLVLFLYKGDKEFLKSFASDLNNLAKNINFCRRCHHLTEGDELCKICSNPQRNQEQICVVEDPLDAISIEKTKAFNGLYYILGGSLSVINQKEIDKLNFNQLVRRVKEEKIKEVIIATNPTTDGETTALYLLRILKPLGVKVTRLGRGLPTGGDIEYADEVTISSAFQGRTTMN